SSAEGQPLAMTTSSIAPPTKIPVVTKESITFGAYDPHGDLGASPNSKIEHLFLPWEDVDLGTLALADYYAQARGRTLLISVDQVQGST
ncbi:beta-mannosidase, partial [Rhizobium ruizarguesonis]